jgi:hypothetical protein
MKKAGLIVLCFALHNVLLACGCDMLINYQGIVPNDYNGMLGFNMRQRYFKGAAMVHTHTNGSEHEHGQMNQLLSNYELNYRFYMSKKLMVAGNIPISDYQFTSSSLNTPVRNTGLGDPILVLKYELISPTQTEETKVKHRLLLGAGLKMPFGSHYKSYSNNLPVDENLLQLQLGSGSLDYIANVLYQLRGNRFGMQTDLSYKLNSKNKYGYHKGNQLNFQGSFFYQKRFQNTVLMPNIGLMYENSLKDEISNFTMDNTGGSNIFGQLGAELFIKKTTLFFNYQHLFMQSLNGFQMKNNLRFTIGFTYNLKFKNK